MAAVVPVGLALVTSLLFALSVLLVRARVHESGPIVALGLSLTTNVVLLWSFSFILYDVTLSVWEWRYFIVAGALAPVLGRFFNFTGIEKLGANLSAPITYAYPIVSVVLAIAFLGERLTWLGIAGAISVIAAGVLLGTVGGNGRVDFDRKHLVLPVLAAVFYGTSQVFRKAGIDLVNQPVLAAAVTTTTSWSLLLGYLLLRSGRHDLRFDRRSAAFFAMSGVVTSIAFPTLYLALQLGTVVVVVPITNSSPLFVLALSFVFFREDELFSRRVVVGTLGIVAGVVLLSTFGTA